MSLLQKKPVFELKVDVFGAAHFIKINGTIILYDFADEGQISVVLPVNNWLRSGENTFGFDLYPPDPGKPFNPGSYVRVALIVHELSEPEKVYTLATLNFSDIEDANQSHTSKSSPSNTFSSSKGFIPDRSGDVRVYDVVSKPRPKEDDFEGAMTFERKISIPNSLPLWAFFNSVEMEDYTNLYHTDENKYDEAMMPLFSVYKKIYDALEKKEFESILPMFEERNRETDLAFYREPGTTAARMLESLQNTIKDLNDNNSELLDLNIPSVSYHLEANKKIVSLRRSGLDQAIILNYINKKEGLGSKSYPLFFRYQNGKYILTR
jgi:DNA-binding transcriptional ArsR family regulator